LVAGIPGAIFALPVVAAVAALRRTERNMRRKSKRNTPNKRR
jgi:predicted PurR-regulated permease PerM